MPIVVDPRASWTYPTSPLAKIAVPRTPNTGPTPSAVTILSPSPGAVLKGTVPIAFDTDFNRTLGTSYLAIDGVLYACVEGGGKGFQFDSTVLGDGAHTVVVYSGATDCEATGRYASSASVAVTSANHYTYPNTGIHFAGGSTQYAKITNAAFTLGDFAGFTVAFWLKVDTGTSFPAVAVAHWSNANFGWYVRLTNAPDVSLWGFNTGGASSNTAPQAFSLDTWHLIVAGWDGQSNANKLYLSIDGGNYVNTALTPLFVSNTLDPFLIGGQGTASGEIKGSMDSLGYWHSRLLSQAEVALLWRSGVGVNNHDITTDATLASLLTNRTAWYDCDDTAGDNVADASGAGLTLLGQNSTSTYTSVVGIR